MKYSVYLAILLFLIPVAPLEASSGSTGTRLPERPPLSKKDLATLRYDAGMKHFNRALKYEHNAQADDKKSAAWLGKAAKENNKSIADFNKAIKFLPRFHEAHASLGLALSKVGRHEESLAAYDESLRINPSYDKAIEYRAEAYLSLNRIDDVKQAYLSLAQSEPALANQLLGEMIVWVGTNRDNPQAADKEAVDRFAEWIDQHRDTESGSQ